MIEYTSKVEDVNFLASALINVLGEKISINEIGLVQEVLTGKYCDVSTKFAKFDGIDFNIKYSKGEFLRINVGEIDLYKPYSEKFNAILELKNAIANIELENGEIIGEPLAFYYIKNYDYYIPYFDWAFQKKEEYISELENNTMFDDGAIIEGLNIFYQTRLNEEKTLAKNKKKI